MYVLLVLFLSNQLSMTDTSFCFSFFIEAFFLPTYPLETPDLDSQAKFALFLFISQFIICLSIKCTTNVYTIAGLRWVAKSFNFQ